MSLKTITSIIILSLFFFKSKAQNQAPIVSNVAVSSDTSNKLVAITYDVNDNENETMNVYLTISGDSGTSFVVPVDNVSGDIGSGISSGSNKSIQWTYSDTIAWFLSKGTNNLNNIIARITAIDSYQIDINELVAQVDSTRMYNDMFFMSSGPRHRSYGSALLNTTKDSITSRFTQHNLQLSFKEFTYNNDIGTNIMGRQAGTTDDESTILITGHFDGFEKSPAADDNASAIAGMLEVTRILTQYNFDHTIKFIAFDMEEDGLKGSLDYVSKIPSYEKIKAVLNFEMIGYYSDEPYTQEAPTGFDILFPTQYQALINDSSKGNFITSAANEYSVEIQDLFDSCANAYVPELKVVSLTIPGNGILVADLNRSDHAPFWWMGYQAIMLSDGSEFRNKSYHSVYDTLGALNMKFMTNVVKATVATVAHSAKINHSGYASSSAFNLYISPLSNIETIKAEENALLKAYPNPFTNEITFEYSVEKKGNFKITVYSSDGKLLKQFEEKNKSRGVHQIVWNVKDQNINLNSGIYTIVLEGEGKSISKNIIYVEEHHH
jgi:hypothetical protein